jgi:hypothetical protein
MTSIPKLAWRSAGVGALVWSICLFFRTGDSIETELLQKVFLLAVFVIVPLGLSLMATPNRLGTHSRIYFLAVVAQPVGAVAALVSFFIEPGITAALLAVIWFVVNILIALYGLSRLLQRGFYPWEETAIDSGMLYLSVGGVWFVISRLGIQPFGFGDTIVFLTAVHFHFAGFAAPILAGMAGRRLSTQRRTRSMFLLAAVGIIGGTPLVAAGITFSPLTALIGAIVISSGLMLLAVLVIGWVLLEIDSIAGRVLLAVSSISNFTAMVLACVYAYSIVEKELIIDIPHMAMTHGLANAFGFALCGMAAWSIIQPKTRAAPTGIPFSRLSAGRYAGPDYFTRVSALSLLKAQPLGLVDQFSVFRRADFDTDRVDPTVKSFYEHTFRYRLVVRPHWQPGFRIGGRVAHLLGGLVGQLRLPVAAEDLETNVESCLLPIDDASDGRTGVCGWIRTYGGTNQAMYVAAYAAHSRLANTYMNIAFPLPGGNLSSILHLAVSTSGERAGGVVLSTLSNAQAGGDQGVYYANQVIPVRLPINEVITVWPAKSQIGGAANDNKLPVLLAKHEMWIFGVNFLNLDYEIYESSANQLQ